MSKIIRTTYKCDYCGKEHEHYTQMYASDNSGMNDKQYDMCSEECYEKHLIKVRKFYEENKHIYGGVQNSIESYVFNHIVFYHICPLCLESPAIEGESLCEECKRTNED